MAFFLRDTSAGPPRGGDGPAVRYEVYASDVWLR